MPDALSTSLMSLDPSFPVLVGGKYSLALVKTEVMTNESHTLKMEFQTTEPSTDIEGKPMKPGSKVFHTLNLKATGKSTDEIVAKSCAAMLQGQKGVQINTIEELEARNKELCGQVFEVNVVATTAGADKTGTWRDARNNIVKFWKAS